MFAASAKLLICSTAAALLTAASAFAQAAEPQSEAFRFSGTSVSAVQELDAAIEIQPLVAQSAAASVAQASVTADDSPAEPGLQTMSPATDAARSASAPWYERFTVSTPSEFRSAWGEESTEFSFSAGERWGFTLGIAEQERGPQFDLEDVSAGAFYELNNRFRVGTNLRFSSPTEDVFGQQGEERVPELKFESAFRF